MRRSTHQILTSHTGALPRPEPLRELLAIRDADQPLDTTLLDEQIRQAVSSVVRQQVEVGLTVVNDGEASKYSFSGYIKDRLTGFATVEGKDDLYARLGSEREQRDFPEFFANRPNLDRFARQRHGPVRRTHCVGPIGWKDFAAVEKDMANLKTATAGSPITDVFVTASSPGNVLQKTPNDYYRTEEEYLQAISDAMHREYAAIVQAGFVLQLDCPDIASRSGPEDYPVHEFRKEVARRVEALNYATRDLPAEQMRMHVCWGSDERPHHLDPELPDFVDILLQARPAGMTIVAANGRHEHEWQVWRDVKVPEGKVIQPGVIDSTTNIIEHPRTVAERIVRFASVLGRENIIAGVDCGFQTTAGRDQVDPKIAWAKLRSLVEGARLASQELWNDGLDMASPHASP